MKSEQSLERIVEWMKDDDIYVSIGNYYNIIKENWNELSKKKIVFRDVSSRQKRKILYTLAEALDIRCDAKVSKPSIVIANQKVIDNPPKGFKITYAYPEVTSMPNIDHSELGPCGKNCEYCKQLPCLRIEVTYKDVYLYRSSKDKRDIHELNFDKLSKMEKPKYEMISF